MDDSVPDRERPPLLSGSVAVDAAGESGRAAWETALADLRAAGWRLGPEDGQIRLADAGDHDPSAQAPTVVRCGTAAEAARFDAIAPDAFAILDGLGGAGLERDLAASVPSGPVADKVAVGLNWTLVRAGDLCGIARSPARGTQGARTIRPDEGFAGKSLRDLAAYLRGFDPLARSLGLAAVNCFWNRPEPAEAVIPLIRPKGGLAGIAPPGDGVVVVGGFRGAQKRLPEARIVEREPKPGDISVEDAPAAFRAARTLAITAETLMNGSLAPILEASAMVPRRLLVGPSAPACPVVLDHGLDETFGAVVIDPDAAERFILETGTMIMLDRIARGRSLRATA